MMMLRKWAIPLHLSSHTLTRSLNIPVRTRRAAQIQKRHRQDPEDKELDEKLKSIRQMEQNLRQYIKSKQEQETKAKIIKQENLKIDTYATDDDIALLESDLMGQKTPDLMGIFNTGLPSSIQERLGTAAVVLLEHNWSEYLKGLSQKGGFTGLPIRDVESFVSMLEFKKIEGAQFVPVVEKLLEDAGISTPTLTHNLMSGYATLGNPEKVEKLAKMVKPSEIVYGHIAKAYFKTRNPTEVPRVIHRMNEIGLSPTKQIYTMAIQSLVQHNRSEEAFVLFDNLKYLSTSSQPDAKMFNTMILAAAKMHNVNKALDLYQEMVTRPINPLVPTKEVLNTLIYACSRDRSTQAKAWDFFIQQRESGSIMGSQSMRALVYLSGETGELMLARKLIGQLCSNPNTYPDDFMVNSLFSAYLNYDRNRVSAMQSSVGVRIRSQLLENIPVSNPDFMPPFLPINELSDEHIVAEAGAMIQFFSESSPVSLQVNNRASASIGAPIVYNLLKIIIKRATMEDFITAWHRFTKKNRRISQPLEVIEGDEIEVEPHTIAINRSQDSYRLAIKAAAHFKDLDFGKSVWIERGQWRKSDLFQSLPLKRRNQLDIGFAREMVTLFCECGDTDSALKLVASSSKMFRWRRVHLEPLLKVAENQEDFETIDAVKGLLHRYWARETRLADVSEQESNQGWR